MNNIKNLENGEAAWIALVILTILACLFSGCADSSYTDTPYVIKKIVPRYPKADKPTICIYSDLHQEHWEIIDSCFKYKIGDTIRLTTTKW